MNSIEIETLSREFTKKIQDWLDNESLEEIDRRNESAEYKSHNLCATHDFCDPNQAMIDVIESLGYEFDVRDERQGAAINKAWTIAKKRGFSRKRDAA